LTLIDPSAQIAAAAIVSPGARIGAGCRIGPFCTIGPEAVLEDGVELVSHVVVEGSTRIGAGSRVLPFASIGTPPQDTKYRGEPTRCEVGARTLVREGVTIHRASVGGAGVTNDIPPFGYVFGLPARLVGFNKIGLLRRGASRDQLRTLRTANALLFKDPGEFAAKLALAAERYAGEPLVMEIIAFIQDGARRRQLVRPGRMAAPELGGVDEENGEGS
jgi:UDP-N-acetylglucosamine acyltransferase